MIKVISKDEAYPIVIESFGRLADKLGMTRENCPGNSAFVTMDTFKAAEVTLYGLFDDDLKGCIAIERKSQHRYKIKYLAVNTSDQHKGYGRKLVTYALEQIQILGGKKVQLGMFRENDRLFNWYLSLGFKVDKIKGYKNKYHVCFMEYSYENFQQEDQ